jgi:C1A family cysteine protease
VPDIAVSPSSLVFNQPDNPRSARNAPQISIESREDDPFIPIDGQYATGLVIPDHVKEYWKTHTPTRKYRSRRNLPTALDWSTYDSPVRNQGSCGSCWAFAATALIENLVHQANLSVENNFAEQVLVSCLLNDGCDGGWYWNAFNYIHQEGIPPESCYPYTASNGSCDRQCATPDFKAKISSFTPANGLWGKTGFNVDDLKGALQDGPLCVAMEVPSSFYGYSGGIYRYTGGSYSWGHAVLLVGYNDTERYFNVKNSWGTWWGEGGYFRISYDDVSSVVKFGSYAATASDIFIEGDSGEIQEVTITNTGTADLTVSNISVDRSWLDVTPTSLSTISPDEEQKISVSVSDWNAVLPPQDVGTITLTTNDPDTPSVEIEVTAMISVMANRPELSISPPFYGEYSTDNGVLTIHVDNSAGETSLDIANYGDGEMAWTASTSDSWLSISDGSEGTNSGRVLIDFSANTSSPRTGTVTVTADGASNSPQDVHINQTELNTDADDDGMPNYFELIYGFDSTNPDDAQGDADEDGLSNLSEYEAGTNPVHPDSDGDCRTDGDEVDQGSDPLVPNPPALGLQDAVTILKVLTGITPDLICSNTDADQNNKVEINDLIFVLRDMAGLR